jgi:hypothetical protein
MRATTRGERPLVEKSLYLEDDLVGIVSSFIHHPMIEYSEQATGQGFGSPRGQNTESNVWF